MNVLSQHLPGDTEENINFRLDSNQHLPKTNQKALEPACSVIYFTFVYSMRVIINSRFKAYICLVSQQFLDILNNTHILYTEKLSEQVLLKTHKAYLTIKYISNPIIYCWTRGSSVGIAMGYWPDGQGSTQDRGKRVFSRSAQTGSGAHPTSYPTGTGDSTPRSKAAGAHLASSSADVTNGVAKIPLPHTSACRGT
jgi:hypothetical protein